MPFRDTSVVHPLYPCVGEPIPMRKPPTGEPCAGEPHARFGGRGRPEPFPTPIGGYCMAKCGQMERSWEFFNRNLTQDTRLERIVTARRENSFCGEPFL